MTDEARKVIQLKNSLRKVNMAANWKNLNLANRYYETRKLVRKMMRCDVRKFEMELANDKKNPKRLFSYVNVKQKVKTHIQSLIDANGAVKTSIFDIANLLAKQFQLVQVKEDKNEPIPNFSNRTDQVLSNIIFSESEVREKLQSLNVHKSTGPDKIHPYFLQKCANTLSKPLTLIFQKSFDNGEMPSQWADANITPLFKGGSKTDPANYRPISLTSVVCKLMEKMVRSALIAHLDQNELINKNQHGFVKYKACVTNLLETIDYLTSVMTSKAKSSVDMIYLDFEKAFDKVPHMRLLHKLKGYGIEGNVLKWIESFLTGRRQRVVLGEVESDWCEVTSSVPQGSVLGPVLFVIYINDMPEVMTNMCKLYADDSKIMAKINNDNPDADAMGLQDDIDNIVIWSEKWKMKLNSKKCKVMHLGKINPKCSYYLHDTVSGEDHCLEGTEIEKDLGVFISANLKAKTQVDRASAKAASVLGRLKNTFVSKNWRLWKKLYTTYVRPHLEYAVASWNPYLKGDCLKLERIQRRATKIPHCMKSLSYEERCEKMDLTSLSTRRIRGDRIQKFKIEKGFDRLTWHKEPRCTQPRGNKRGQFIAETHSKAERNNFFNNRIAGPWNELPDNIVEAETVNIFKERLDSFTKKQTQKKH